jgi:prepilin-type N-terminal cleavage/methylation domain-containing protein
MRHRSRSDAGFSLVETLTSIAIIGVVMTALTTFFVATTTTLNKQRGLQTAVRLAQDGVELVKSLPVAKVVAGRSAKDVAAQFDSVVIPGFDVKGLLTTMLPVADTTLGNLAASSAPALPVVPESLEVDNTEFNRHWFVGSCQMPLGGGDCGLSPLTGTALTFYRVLVAVTWNNDRACATTGGVCSYVTQTLVTASATDPIFNPDETVVPPLPDNPGDRTDEVGVPMAAPMVMTATTAYPPLTWSADGTLPPGIEITTDGVINGTPTSPGIYQVRVTVKDRVSTNDAAFTWTVAALPVAAPVDQTWDYNAQVSYAVPLTGGIAPYKWTQVGLPTGLSIDAATGVVTGSSKVSGAASRASVTVTVTDKNAKTSSATFQWHTRVVVQYPTATTPVTLKKGEDYSGSGVGALGGSGGYTWSATDLPPGLSLSPAGVLTGKVTGSTRYLVTLTVTDSLGGSNSTLVPVNVTTQVPTELRVTGPSVAATAVPPERSSAKDAAVSLPLTATAGTGPYTWTVDNLPTGLVFNASTATITGAPKTAGSWTVRLTVTDAAGARSVFMFVWKIS